ncbi:MAG: hypothetical protein IPH10_09070 [bacterium]|nr:hypothetical protein [bacterium]
MITRALLLLLFLLCFAACDGDDPQIVEPVPTIQAVSMPTDLLCNDDSVYVFSMRVANIPGVTHVECTITGPSGGNSYTMLLMDDGGSAALAGPDFASTTSLDIVPNNGTFTRGLRADLLCLHDQGVYRFDFFTRGGDRTVSIENVDIELRQLSVCLMSGIDTAAASSFPACFEPRDLSVTITQPQGIAIDSVRAAILDGDTLYVGVDMQPGSGDNWSVDLAPRLFGVTPAGSDYTLRMSAFTRFGLTCVAEIPDVYIDNALPVVSNLQLPDTLYRPVSTGDIDTIEFYISYEDCELATWSQTNAVWFDVRREDLEWPPQTFADFFLRNDGVAPDLAVGDNIASAFLQVPNRPDLPNYLYYFRFYSIDPASGDSTDYLLDSTRIIQPGALNDGGTPTDGLGLSTYK